MARHVIVCCMIKASDGRRVYQTRRPCYAHAGRLDKPARQPRDTASWNRRSPAAGKDRSSQQGMRAGGVCHLMVPSAAHFRCDGERQPTSHKTEVCMMNGPRRASHAIAGRCRRRWGIAAVLTGLMIAAAATPVTAAHRIHRPHGGYQLAHRSGNVWSGYRHHPRPHRQAHNQFDLGFAAGSNDGWKNGYDDGRYRRALHPRARARSRRCSSQYLAGYNRGYTYAYSDGYNQGRRDRWRRPSHRHR